MQKNIPNIEIARDNTNNKLELPETHYQIKASQIKKLFRPSVIKTQGMDARGDEKMILIRTILQKPEEQRTSFELDTVLGPLMAGISFFQERNLSTAEMSDICIALQYAQNPANSVVIRYGEQGDMFYIILKGKVAVWVPVPTESMARPLLRFNRLLNNRPTNL